MLTPALIHHGTPLTPRAALLEVCGGRAMCVSFFRPDDVDAVEEISPAVMYDNGAFSFWMQALRAGQEWAGDRDWMPFLSLARTTPVPPWPVGGDPRHAGGTQPAQRQLAIGLAIWLLKRGAAVAHGWPYRAPRQVVRAVQQSRTGVDRRSQEGACGLRRISQAHGRSGGLVWQRLATDPHDARNGCSVRLSVPQRGQHQPRAERLALRYGARLRGSLGREAGLC